jgi:ATP-dependent DNA helicase RecG
LINLGVLVKNGAGLVLNNAGVLFFAKDPARILPHCVVTCLLFKGNSKVHILVRKSFEFDLLRNIDEAVLFIERHLNLAYEIKELRRKEILEIPEFVIREAIVNAVAHRDYFERGANVQVDIFDDRIEISNPGGLPKGLKPENFGKYSVTRNSLISALLHRCNYVERAGTGIQRMRDGMKEAGRLEPSFEFSGFFTIILPRNKVVEKKMKEGFLLRPDRMKRMLAIAQSLRDGVSLDINLLSVQLSASGRSIRRDLEILEQHGWVKSSGATRNKQYSLTTEGLKSVTTQSDLDMSK